jgi:arsenate reductase
MDEPREPFNVLFLCTGNSARSILAEALLNKLGGRKFRAFSAGSFPKGQVNPHALILVEGLGFDPADFRSKSWDEFARPDSPPLDFIFTVCDNAAGEVCPIWPGQPMTAHWGIPDPAEAPEGETRSETEIALAFADACRQLRNRISLFVELPVEKLERSRLQHRLREIGQSADGLAACEPARQT